VIPRFVFLLERLPLPLLRKPKRKGKGRREKKRKEEIGKQVQESGRWVGGWVERGYGCRGTDDPGDFRDFELGRE
jgi:hypothetical protein